MNHRISWLLSLGFSLVIAARPASAAETSNTIQFVPPCDGSLAGLGPVAIRLRLFPDPIQSFSYEETQQLNADMDGCLSTPDSVSGSTVFVGNGTTAGIPAAVFATNPSMWIAFALDSAPDDELGGGRVPVSSSGYSFSAVNASNALSAQNALN